jgi:hypothetical protein
VALVLAGLCGCNCGKPPVTGADAGPDAGPMCVMDTDCPLGFICSGGQCMSPMSFDASEGCMSDSDCPMGQRCLKSAGQCITPADSGMDVPDAGPTGDCFEGQTMSCGVSKLGECRLGTSTCTLVDGRWQLGACLGEVDPTPETCNGLDDNCNGLVDDGLGDLTCGTGECTRTVPACAAGMAGTCTPGSPTAEVCDGLDNDCNGLVDEGLTASCGVGACARTQSSCVDGGSVACVPGTPTAEVCNGIDDNCNGTADEGLVSSSCGVGACARVVQSCIGGVAQTCTPGLPSTELCNGVDDNCNGVIDEGCACVPGAVQGCYSGPAGTADAGICHGGSQFCDAGMWGSCSGQQLPLAMEQCNGLDDTCNGAVDEGLGSSSCGVGACARVAQNCLGGMTQTCKPGDAGTELCNNIDDDCDGIVDDHIVPATLTCGVGACQRTVASCAGGVTQTCTAGSPGTEVCNGIDDNCNGMTDETFPQSGMPCPTGVPGTCATGVFQCMTGVLSCKQTVFAVMEICNNGLDDDCNGIVDDPMACGCNTSVDKDLDGYNQCVDCNDNNGAIHPMATELCDGIDNNCNGKIDEGFDVDMDTFTTCGTVPDGGGIDPRYIDCNDGNNYVFPLKTFDCGNAATPTTANNVDDNCNGYKDESCACSNTDKDGDGFTPCQGDCNDSDATIYPGAPELCDGKDNDCNKLTVDNCDVSQPCGSKVGPSYQPFPAGTDQCKPDLVCVTNTATGALICGSFCNQTTGLGLNDSCAAGQGCNTNLIDSDDQSLCAVIATGAAATGAMCAVNSDCRSGACTTTAPKYCTDDCTHQAGCSANTTCIITQVAQSQPPLTYHFFTSTCALTSTLSGTKTTGQACSGTQCVTGAAGCFGGVCVAPCCSNAECPAGFVCSINGPTVKLLGAGTQVSQVPVCLASAATRTSGQACTTSTQCKSGICEATRGVCIDVCCNDTVCPSGQTCQPMTLNLSNGNVIDAARVCVFPPVPTSITQK